MIHHSSTSTSILPESLRTSKKTNDLLEVTKFVPELTSNNLLNNLRSTHTLRTFREISTGIHRFENQHIPDTPEKKQWQIRDQVGDAIFDDNVFENGHLQL